MVVKTDIIISTTVNLIGQAVILVIMYVEILKTNVIVFIGYIIMCLISLWPIIFSIRVGLLILTISLGEIKERQSIDTGNIPWWDQIETVHWYWQYPLVRSKRDCPLILTISLGEIKERLSDKSKYFTGIYRYLINKSIS